METKTPETLRQEYVDTCCQIGDKEMQLQRLGLEIENLKRNAHNIELEFVKATELSKLIEREKQKCQTQPPPQANQASQQKEPAKPKEKSKESSATKA
jgi:hypothetical protein